MRGDNLSLEVIQKPKTTIQTGFPKHSFGREKFMVSVGKDLYLALLEETKERGFVTIQDTVRTILADWYKRTRFEGSPK